MVKFFPESMLSEVEAADLLIDLAIYSNYRPLDAPPFQRVSEIAEYLGRKGLSIPECAKSMRVYSEPPQYFFNLVGPTWQVKGATVSKFDPASGVEREIIAGDGQYHTANYWAKYDQAQSDFERSIAESNHELLLSAFAKGQAAIENFLNTLPIAGIKDCSVEEKMKKVFLDRTPAGNWDIERQKEPWASFIEMKRIRNKQEIHNKTDSTGFTYAEIHTHFNLFSRAISQTLFELHKARRMRCPASIVRSSYFPQVHMKAEG